MLSAAQKRKLEKNSRSYAKPAWAYTQEGKETAEEEEADELLAFAQSLDFDKYLDNIEVVEAMEAAKAQLEALEREQEVGVGAACLSTSMVLVFDHLCYGALLCFAYRRRTRSSDMQSCSSVVLSCVQRQRKAYVLMCCAHVSFVCRV